MRGRGLVAPACAVQQHACLALHYTYALLSGK